MQLIAVVGPAVFVVTGAIIGARLLMLARRTRELPELLMGTGLFVYSVLAQPLSASFRRVAAAHGETAGLVTLGGSLAAVFTTTVCLYTFNWYVFRRSSRAARALVLVPAAAEGFACAMLLVCMARFGIGEAAARAAAAPYLFVLVLAFVFSMGWTSSESLLYYAQMRKRLALGLADPIVTNRFLIWGLGCAACGAIALTLVGFVAAGANIATDAGPLLAISAAGITASVCWYLSFLPPARYRRWLLERGAR